MSRKSRKRERRDSAEVSHRPLTVRLLSRPSALIVPTVAHDLRLDEDRRSFHPLGMFRPPRVVGGHPVQPLVVREPAKRKRSQAFLAHQLGFPNPKRVLLCVRRKTRREVLFAKNLSRKGAGARRRHRNFYSEVKC